jgi:hypothetical protein
MHRTHSFIAAVALICPPAFAQVAVRADLLHTMAGEPIADALVLIGESGDIEFVGTQGERAIPEGYETHDCAVATPGLVDVRSTLGFTGIYNQDADQEQVDGSARMQPGLRAIDAYNPRDRLIGYSRSFGVTTVHTGHGPGELISGQTMIAKTRGGTVDEAVVVPAKAVAATLGPSAHKGGGTSPGTRAKAMQMLRGELIKARAYAEKAEAAEGRPRDRRADARPGAGDARVRSGGRSAADRHREPFAGHRERDAPRRRVRVHALARLRGGGLPLHRRTPRAGARPSSSTPR